MTESYPEVAGGVRQVDLLEHGTPGVTSGYFIAAPKPAVVDIGGVPSVPVWLDALASFSVRPTDVAYVIVTHIHLDHAGGTGHMLRHMPEARVVVHPRGARHLTDPSRLISGARAVFGDNLERYFGMPEPVPESRLLVVEDGAMLDLGEGHTLRFIDAPGHARHQHMVLDTGARALLAGDELGERLPAIADDYVIPDTAPNQFDADAMLRSARRLRDLRPEAILLSHFGRFPGSYDALSDRLVKEVPAVAALGEIDGRRATRQEIASALIEHVRDDLARRGIAWTPAVRGLLEERLAISAQGIADYHARRATSAP
ncbi:MAG TPA: MBL fold metallo-hydrolase [bacterium]|nr:MBL fold metallo-hydrolase [bacterium]